MAKTKSAYVCSDCGATALQWFGACPSCGAAGTLTETIAERGSVKRIAGSAPGAISLDAVETRELERLSTGIGELDRVLGGGLVAGQVVLIGGDPGIGKSTLLLQALAALGSAHKVLYISGEESAEQVAMRARRLALDAGAVRFIAEIQLERIVAIGEHEVAFRVRVNGDGGKKRTLRVPGTEFIKRFVQHVLPRGFKRIRHYGLLGAAHKSAHLAAARTALAAPQPQPAVIESVAAFMQRVAKIEWAACPHCRLGQFKLVQAIAPHPRCQPSRGPP